MMHGTTNIKFHNETKTALTLSHAILHIYETKSVTRKRYSLRYTHRRSGSTKEMKLTPHNKTDVQRQIIQTNQTKCNLLQQAWSAKLSVQFEVAVLRLVPAAGRAIM